MKHVAPTAERAGATAHKTLINRKTLLQMIPLCDRAIYNLEQRGEFPRRIALTARAVAWDLGEVEAWIEARRSAKALRPGAASSN